MERGRVDIHTEVSMLSAHQASPRRGHLSALYQIFAYLKQKPKLSLYFDPRLPNIDYSPLKLTVKISKNITVMLKMRTHQQCLNPVEDQSK